MQKPKAVTIPASKRRTTIKLALDEATMRSIAEHDKGAIEAGRRRRVKPEAKKPK